jgi:hypothetical protein
VEFSAIANIHKYRGLQEGHHFILMATEVHGIPEHDMDRFIRECVCFFHDRRSGDHLFLSFCIQIFKQRVSIVFQCALTSIIKRKIALVGNAYFRPPMTIRFHDLHASNIRRAVGEIASYHEKD